MSDASWAFGLAPVKPSHQDERKTAASTVLAAIEESRFDAETVDSLSVVKGLFSRTFRQDQWDWFTVAVELALPTPQEARQISVGLAELRRALILEDPSRIEVAADHLRRLPTGACLRSLLGLRLDHPGLAIGWLLLQSTRENPDLLWLRSAQGDLDRLLEVARDTEGSPLPWGVRSAWRVSNPAQALQRGRVALVACQIAHSGDFYKSAYRPAHAAVEQEITDAGLIAQLVR